MDFNVHVNIENILIFEVKKNQYIIVVAIVSTGLEGNMLGTRTESSENPCL